MVMVALLTPIGASGFVLRVVTLHNGWLVRYKERRQRALIAPPLFTVQYAFPNKECWLTWIQGGMDDEVDARATRADSPPARRRRHRRLPRSAEAAAAAARRAQATLPGSRSSSSQA
jgi:hypothetical protein